MQREESRAEVQPACVKCSRGLTDHELSTSGPAALCPRRTFGQFSAGCKYKVELGVPRRPCNGLNVEVGQPADRCMNRPPNVLGSIRWLASGGSPLALGVCCAEACPSLGRR